MKKAIKLFGIIVRVTFEAFFTYVMFALLGLGFTKLLWLGVVAGLIGIVYGMSDLFESVVWGEEDLDQTSSKPPLYAKIEEEDGLFYFQVYAMNHELICVSDAFATHDGAITGLWYLMDSMKKMDELSWDFR